jgi:hypothetical protein
MVVTWSSEALVYRVIEKGVLISNVICTSKKQAISLKSTTNCTALLGVLLFGIVLTLKSLGACAVTIAPRVVCFTSHFTPIMASVQQKAQCVLWYAEFYRIIMCYVPENSQYIICCQYNISPILHHIISVTASIAK